MERSWRALGITTAHLFNRIMNEAYDVKHTTYDAYDVLKSGVDETRQLSSTPDFKKASFDGPPQSLQLTMPRLVWRSSTPVAPRRSRSSKRKSLVGTPINSTSRRFSASDRSGSFSSRRRPFLTVPDFASLSCTCGYPFGMPHEGSGPSSRKVSKKSKSKTAKSRRDSGSRRSTKSRRSSRKVSKALKSKSRRNSSSRSSRSTSSSRQAKKSGRSSRKARKTTHSDAPKARQSVKMTKKTAKPRRVASKKHNTSRKRDPTTGLFMKA